MSDQRTFVCSGLGPLAADTRRWAFKMAKKVVCLDHIGTGLIIKWPTGIFYSNQAGGTFCIAPEEEGFFFPFGNDADENNIFLSKEDDLCEYFTGPKVLSEGAIRGITEKNANDIDEMLSGQLFMVTIKVDRTKLKQSHEAWVHVLVYQNVKINENLCHFRGFDSYPLKAVLIWCNSD